MNYNCSHPILTEDLIDELNIRDQIFSVEGSLDTLIPWIKYITKLENKKVLVFGTGGGGTTVATALNIGDGEVYGVDINEWAISTTRKRAEAYSVMDKVKLFYLEITCPLPFEDEFFDLVIIADVIEHIIDERGKYLRENFAKLKKEGLLIITGTPNLIYPYDFHTTGLFLIPWLSSKWAYKYALWRGRCKPGTDLDYAGRKGTTFWHIKKWLRNENYEILNLKAGFTSEYLKSHNRINNHKRRLLFLPYSILESVCSKFSIPITAFMPYINHLFIKKMS